MFSTFNVKSTHSSTLSRDGVLVPSWGRKNKAKEKVEESSWKLGEYLGSPVLKKTLVSLKGQFSLPGIWPTNFLHFVPAQNSHVMIFISIACFTTTFYLQCVFQGNAILMKQCRPCFHVAHRQEWLLIIKSSHLTEYLLSDPWEWYLRITNLKELHLFYPPPPLHTLA